MKRVEQAKIILEELDEYFQINHTLEEYYIKAICKGLDRIEKSKDSN